MHRRDSLLEVALLAVIVQHARRVSVAAAYTVPENTVRTPLSLTLAAREMLVVGRRERWRRASDRALHGHDADGGVNSVLPTVNN